MSQSYLQVVTEDRRLVLLRILAEAPEYRSNDSVLRKALHQLGHDPSRGQVVTDLHWLQEMELVSLDDSFRPVTVATLTERGLDVGQGRAQVPGVARPSPTA